MSRSGISSPDELLLYMWMNKSQELNNFGDFNCMRSFDHICTSGLKSYVCLLYTSDAADE